MSALPTRATLNAQVDRDSSSDESSEDDQSINQSIDQSILRPHFGYIGSYRPTDDFETATTIDQSEVEQRLKYMMDDWLNGDQPFNQSINQSTNRLTINELHRSIALKRVQHRAYLTRNIELLPSSYQSLDSSRPWLVYWILHSMTLIHQSNNQSIDQSSDQSINQSNDQSIVGSISLSLCERCIDFLSRCQSPSGGFCGAPPPPQSINQSINRSTAHLAPTYAAILSLSIISAAQPSLIDRALGMIDRPMLAKFLLSMKQADGSFSVTEDGECDTRGAYTALVSASLTGLLDKSNQSIDQSTNQPFNQSTSLRSRLLHNTPEWLASCQRYEGGVGGEPGNEAHGGYSFCGLASSILCEGVALIDLLKFSEWTCYRQHGLEGGLSGRTNKLVDGCYAFWVAALEPLLQYAVERVNQSNNQSINQSTHLKSLTSMLDARALQRYVLLACQANTGGLRDKPGKHPDLYHTCYCLSGLSIAQQCESINSINQPIVGLADSAVQLTNPVYNIHQSAVDATIAYFNVRPFQE